MRKKITQLKFRAEMGIIMTLQSVKETAKRFQISARRVQKLCEEGRIEGAQMISNVWVIPDTAKKPLDERYLTEMVDMISLADLCKELSISIATGRNWVKLGKLVPTSIIKRNPYFTQNYVSQLKKDLQNGTITSLKSRRNKKYISGNSIYRSYVSETSENTASIQSVIDTIEQSKIEITEELTLALLAECAVQLILHRTQKTSETHGLKSFIEGKYQDNPYLFLVSDLLKQNTFTTETTEKYANLLAVQYKYEHNEDILGLLYLSLKNIGSRKATGSYYTPTKIVKKLCTSLLQKNEPKGKTIIDPCCGTGNFLLQLPAFFAPEHIFGNDIDTISVKLARINYALKFMITEKQMIYSHITEQDYLLFSHNLKFDFIIGNPPWGYEYSKEEKERLRANFISAAGSNMESYDMFIEQAFHHLKPDGILSFIIPEAFLNVKAHRPIRNILLTENSIQYLEFLGNAFDKVQCPCILLQCIHTGTAFSSVGLTVNDGTQTFTIQQERNITADCFSFRTTDEEYHLLDKIKNHGHKTTLNGQADFALGIVTGNNKKFITDEKREDNEMILKGSDLCKYRFHDTDHYIVFKPESFQQVAPTQLYRAEEKLLYRFICNQLVFAYDNRKTLSLNSCNILIPQIPGVAIKFVMAVLNSRIAQFYFKKTFHSVKVLRSHIEQIPIPVADKVAQENIIQLADLLISATDENTIIEIYDKIDWKMAEIYNLSREEYILIQKSMREENLFLF